MRTAAIFSIIYFLAYNKTGKVSSESSHVVRSLSTTNQKFLDALREMLTKADGTKQNCCTASGSGGAVYTRWGRKDCPSGSRLVYTGSAGGSHYNHKGGSANTLCLPKVPEYGRYTSSSHSRGHIYGTEYDIHNQLPGFNHLHDQDVPCAVCKTRVNRNILMIPAKKSCPRGWRQEYTGYLMGGHHNVVATVDYLCVDAAAQPLNSGYKNADGHLLNLIEGQCGSLPCPPYKYNWELTCVVCSQ